MKRQIIKTKPQRPYRIARIIIVLLILAALATLLVISLRPHTMPARQHQSNTSALQDLPIFGWKSQSPAAST